MTVLFDLELEKIREIILNRQYKKIFLQMPEGMLDIPLKTVLEALSPLGAQVIVGGDPSYGFCDLAINIATLLRCDLLIHYGHSEFGFRQKIHSKYGKSLDLLIIPAFVSFEISSYFSEVLEKLKELGWNNVGLVATIQHMRNLEELKAYLDAVGITYTVQGGGQILGCHTNNVQGFSKEVDGIISLHAGYFHSHGLLMSTSIPILQLNPFTGELKLFSLQDRKKSIQKRFSIINKARDAKVWGILGSSKVGQYRPNRITKAEKLLNDHNKVKMTLIAENIDFQNLTNFIWIDAWLNTACPRLALDDHINLKKPVLTFKEFLYLFNEITWEDILTTGFF
ncbi:MAG: diphthamide biosynthesis enzyme Dph2 [Promethearchaeota archaeon]